MEGSGTGVGHVEKCPRRVSLNAHIFGPGEPGQRTERSRSRDLGLVILVRGEVGDAADGVALHLDVGRHHLSDEGSQATQEDDGDFVLRCQAVSIVMLEDFTIVKGDRGARASPPPPGNRSGGAILLLTARLPKAALAARCTSMSGLLRRKRIGSRVSRSTSRTSR